MCHEKRADQSSGIVSSILLWHIRVWTDDEHSNKDLTTEMTDATLPVVSLYVQTDSGDGLKEINKLRGYTEKMNGIYMRDTITPVGTDRLLPIQVRTYDTQVDGISYEIRSMDMDRLIGRCNDRGL